MLESEILAEIKGDKTSKQDIVLKQNIEKLDVPNISIPKAPSRSDREIKIFISSTFRDMDMERDLLSTFTLLFRDNSISEASYS